MSIFDMDNLLQSIASECIGMVECADIPYGNIKEFKVNTRAKRRWGLCRRASDGFHIEINYQLLENPNAINGLKNTIIHEILHTCEGCQNHGSKWLAYASRINNLYGMKIKRTSSAEDKGVEEIEEEPIYKYAAVCPKCGVLRRYQRKGNVVAHPENYRCRHCGGTIQIVNLEDL